MQLQTSGGWHRDAIAVAVVVLSFFLLAGQVELFEQVLAFTRMHERWQLDEVPLSLVCLSLGLVWFSWRRVHEGRQVLAARIAAEQQAQKLLTDNRELAQALIRVQDTERRALARELHDEFGQHCTAIRADARYIGRATADAAMQDSAARIDHSAERLHLLVRQMLDRLRPPDLDSLGLEAAVQALCERWETQTGIGCAFVPRGVADLGSGSGSRLPDDVAVTVYRLVQEALTNVARHAGATHVQITLSPSPVAHAVRLRIVDDGCGLNDAGTPSDASRRGGHGLIGMRERVAALGGTLALRPAEGGGLLIEADLPWREAQT